MQIYHSMDAMESSASAPVPRTGRSQRNSRIQDRRNPDSKGRVLINGMLERKERSTRKERSEQDIGRIKGSVENKGLGENKRHVRTKRKISLQADEEFRAIDIMVTLFKSVRGSWATSASTDHARTLQTEAIFHTYLAGCIFSNRVPRLIRAISKLSSKR